MGRVRNFISKYLSNQEYISVDFDVNSKDVDGFNFYLSVDGHKISTGDFMMIRRKDYLYLIPPYRFEICTKDKIDLADSKQFFCGFNGHKNWYDLPEGENIFQDEDLDLHVRYDIPRWVRILYSRYDPKPLYPISLFDLYLQWDWDYHTHNNDFIKISITKLEKLFENSEHLEQDVSDYLKKVVIEPTIEYYKKLVVYIFNSDILETIFKTIRELSNS